MNMPLRTADEGAFGVGENPPLVSQIAETAYVVLLLLVFVGFTAFAPRTAEAIAARDLASGAGDSVRQISFLSVFLVIAATAILQRGMAVCASVPVLLVALIAWCALSALWADAPDIALRRAILAAMLVWSVMLSVDTLGSARSLALLRYVFAAILIADFLSVLFVPAAMHLSNDVESSLAGAWRGLHSHKNTAGFFAASAAVLFGYFALQTRRAGDILLCVAALVFLAMTHSKSSMGLLPVALALGAIYHFAGKSILDRQIAYVATALCLLVCAIAIVLAWDTIARVLEDPEQLTGRAAIWQAELAFIRDHPLLGSGFATFANTGVHSPIYRYVGPTWVATIGEGHGGYLELLVTIGGIGFALALASLVVQPFLEFWRGDAASACLYVLLFTLFFFVILHNFMESDFLEGTAPQWGEFLLILALLRVARRESRDVQTVYGVVE